MDGVAGAPQGPRTLIVTASDSRFMPLLRGMLETVSPNFSPGHVDLACFDIGLAPADVAWLRQSGARVEKPKAHLGVREDGVRPALLSFLARPFLPAYFPGYKVYVWIDSDVWLQDPDVLATYREGAMRQGMAIAHESEPSYRFQAWLLAWTGKHFLKGYGIANAAWLLAQRHVNAGFFAIRDDAPHWDAWAKAYEAAIRRTGALVPHDQFALNHALYGSFGRRRALPTCFLPPTCNWICDRGVPMWNDGLAAFCAPRAPFRPIRAMHLAGPAKRSVYTIRRTDGGAFATCLVRGARPETPASQPLVPA